MGEELTSHPPKSGNYCQLMSSGKGKLFLFGVWILTGVHASALMGLSDLFKKKKDMKWGRNQVGGALGELEG